MCFRGVVVMCWMSRVGCRWRLVWRRGVSVGVRGERFRSFWVWFRVNRLKYFRVIVIFV